MKLAVIGGGGVRSMFLAKSLVQRAYELHIDEIIFMDNNETKLNIYGKMAREVAKRIDTRIKFGLTSNAEEALKDADYVITTIRVGEDQKRIDDEKIALSHNVLGQETTGAAGFSFAMRSIPELVKYCEIIKKVSKPSVKMFNFTNPAGVVSQTLRDLGYHFTFGICDAPSSLLHEFAHMYGAEAHEISGDCFGLNHLSFFKTITLRGKDITQEVLDNDKIYTDTEMRYFPKAFAKDMNHILNEYLYYFFFREQAVENILKAGVTRGEVIKDVNIHMTEVLSKMDIENDFENCLKVFEEWYEKREGSYMANETGNRRNKPAFKFDIHEKDAGGYAGVALKYIETELSGKSAEMILCVPNNGAIKELLDTDVVEVTCTITKDGYTPHKVDKIDEIPLEIIRRVKIYERYASSAIINKSKKDAINALMVHPLINSFSLAEQIVNEYLESNKEYIGEWK